jgi:hypothetical protein
MSEVDTALAPPLRIAARLSSYADRDALTRYITAKVHTAKPPRQPTHAETRKGIPVPIPRSRILPGGTAQVLDRTRITRVTNAHSHHGRRYHGAYGDVRILATADCEHVETLCHGCIESWEIDHIVVIFPLGHGRQGRSRFGCECPVCLATLPLIIRRAPTDPQPPHPAAQPRRTEPPPTQPPPNPTP